MAAVGRSSSREHPVETSPSSSLMADSGLLRSQEGTQCHGAAPPALGESAEFVGHAGGQRSDAMEPTNDGQEDEAMADDTEGLGPVDSAHIKMLQLSSKCRLSNVPFDPQPEREGPVLPHSCRQLLVGEKFNPEFDCTSTLRLGTKDENLHLVTCFGKETRRVSDLLSLPTSDLVDLLRADDYPTSAWVSRALIDPLDTVSVRPVEDMAIDDFINDLEKQGWNKTTSMILFMKPRGAVRYQFGIVDGQHRNIVLDELESHPNLIPGFKVPEKVLADILREDIPEVLLRAIGGRTNSQKKKGAHGKSLWSKLMATVALRADAASLGISIPVWFKMPARSAIVPAISSIGMYRDMSKILKLPHECLDLIKTACAQEPREIAEQKKASEEGRKPTAERKWNVQYSLLLQRNVVNDNSPGSAKAKFMWLQRMLGNEKNKPDSQEWYNVVKRRVDRCTMVETKLGPRHPLVEEIQSGKHDSCTDEASFRSIIEEALAPIRRVSIHGEAEAEKDPGEDREVEKETEEDDRHDEVTSPRKRDHRSGDTHVGTKLLSPMIHRPKRKQRRKKSPMAAGSAECTPETSEEEERGETEGLLDVEDDGGHGGIPGSDEELVSLLDIAHSGIGLANVGTLAYLTRQLGSTQDATEHEVDMGIVRAPVTPLSRDSDDRALPREAYRSVGEFFGRFLSDRGTLLVFSPMDLGTQPNVLDIKRDIEDGSGDKLVASSPSHIVLTKLGLEPVLMPTWIPPITSELIWVFHRAKGDQYVSWNGNPHEWRASDFHNVPWCSSYEYVYSADGESATKHLQAEQTPLLYMMALMLMFTRPGDRILEIVCGAGTTAMASVLTGRKYDGIDSNIQAIRCTTARLAALERRLAEHSTFFKSAFDWESYTAHYFDHWRGLNGEETELLQFREFREPLNNAFKALAGLPDWRELLPKITGDWSTMRGRLLKTASDGKAFLLGVRLMKPGEGTRLPALPIVCTS